MEKEPITSQGLEKIKKELEELKNIKRPKIIEAIAEARAHGDLKENAEYHAAKEEQSKIESRIIKINDLIARANVIDVTKLEKKDKVVFGSTVSLIDLKSNESKTYKIVGKDEADINKNYIYFKSPIGKALIGKNKKDLMTVVTPSGEKNFQITEVKYI
jgi:transcription elongation factor GreA|tara:strand:- start:195 stop:671 length:477 start_codon:yes stop_codon:yes gene_type:complete